MDIGGQLTQYGLQGLVIFVEGLVILYLNKKTDELTKQIFALQEQRRLESVETAEKLHATLDAFTQTTQLIFDKIKAVKR